MVWSNCRKTRGQIYVDAVLALSDLVYVRDRWGRNVLLERVIGVNHEPPALRRVEIILIAISPSLSVRNGILVSKPDEFLGLNSRRGQ